MVPHSLVFLKAIKRKMNTNKLEDFFHSTVYVIKVIIGISLIIYGMSIKDSTVMSIGAFILVYSGRKEAKSFKIK